ncbi:ABC transporter substrate-binding protein [Paenibacillus sp. GCM10027626]|uniref:ABC transporter substrate-binding protein n=1 Tax=Paenibacillus sp. GCM10027626 TaxID=3273411 RepID=UPI00363D9D9A
MNRNTAILLAALLLVVTTALSACSESGNNKRVDSKYAGDSEAAEDGLEAEPFTMTIRHTQVGESKKFRLALLKDVIRQTEADVPGLQIDFDPVEDNANRFTKLPAEMTAGNPPQIFDLFGGMADAVKYAKAGRLLDLTPIIEELGLKDSFIDLSQYTVDGRVYGLPIGTSQEGFFYNKKLFAELGLRVPATMEELEHIMEQLKQENIVPIAMASKATWVPVMLLNTMMARYAGEHIMPGFMAGTVKWNSPEIVAAWEKYNEWQAKEYFTKGELGYEYIEMRNQLLTGKAGMMFDGSWASSVFTDPQQAGDMIGSIGYFAMPSVPGGKGDQTAVNANLSNGYGFSSNLNEQELKAVKAFIQNMYNVDMQIRGLKEDNVLPSFKIDQDLKSLVEAPLLKEVLDVQAKAGEVFPVFDAFVQSEVNKEVELGLAQIIAGKGKADPVKILNRIQAVQDKANRK